MTFIVDKFKLIFHAVTAVILLIFALAFISIDVWIAAGICIAGFIICFILALINGRLVRFSDEGVELKLFSFTRLKFTWDEIAEAGVIGTKVFRMSIDKTNYVGSRYIYFSRVSMTDDERFQMALKWPPKDKIYIRFSKKRIQAVIDYWGEEFTAYNAGHIDIG